MTKRRLPARLLLLAAALLVGCQSATYVDRQRVDQEPLVIDQAMQQRQWDPVTAKYENGDTRSGTTGFAYTSRNNLPPLAFSAADTGTFVVNVVTLPYTFYQQWFGVTSGGVELPPSYTANPPLPPSTQPE